jgi:hypothetical protein
LHKTYNKLLAVEIYLDLKHAYDLLSAHLSARNGTALAEQSLMKLIKGDRWTNAVHAIGS